MTGKTKPNSMKLRTQLLSGYALVFVLMTVIAVVTYRGIGSLTDTARWVSHTQEVIGEAHLIEKLLLDMETGQRGFLITGSDEFLDPYRDGIEDLKNNFTALRILIADAYDVPDMKRAFILPVRS